MLRLPPAQRGPLFPFHRHLRRLELRALLLLAAVPAYAARREAGGHEHRAECISHGDGSVYLLIGDLAVGEVVIGAVAAPVPRHLLCKYTGSSRGREGDLERSSVPRSRRARSRAKKPSTKRLLSIRGVVGVRDHFVGIHLHGFSHKAWLSKELRAHCNAVRLDTNTRATV